MKNILEPTQTRTFQDKEGNWVKYKLTPTVLDKMPAFQCKVLTKTGWKIFATAENEIKALAYGQDAWNSNLSLVSPQSKESK